MWPMAPRDINTLVRALSRSTKFDSLIDHPPDNTYPNPSNGAAPQGDATNAQEETPSHDVTHLPDDKMTDEIFRSHWVKGEPLVVTDVLSKFRIEWTPEYFIEKYGGQNCLIIECQTEENKRTSVAEFFKDFGKYEGRKSCWKLKVNFLMPYTNDILICISE